MDQLFDTIKTIFNFDIVRRLFFLAGIAASVAVGVGLYQWVQEPTYRPLPYAVTDQSLSSISEALDKANIAYKINDRTGTVSVPMSDLANAKRKLAAAGIQKEDGFSYSFLSEQNKLGTSQFVENARYLRALESDLARTIRSIQGISNAKVHIAIPQNNIFADENTKPTASIIVQATPGYEGDKEKVRAIVQLVAASVPELDPSHIAITDQYGHDLTSSLNKDSILNQEQLTFQNNLQQYYEKRIQNLLTPMIGVNKASINVHTDIDFTQQEEAHEEYDPNQTAIRSEQSTSESSSIPSASGVPGSLSNQPPSNNSSSSQQASSNGSSGQGGASSGGQNRNENVKNYEVSKSMRYVHNSAPKINRISVAVVLDNESIYNNTSKRTTSKPITKEKLAEITELIKTTIGFNENRKDRVTVVNSGFVQPNIEEIVEPAIWEQPWFLDWAKRVGGMLIGFIFLFILYRKISPELKPKQLNKDTNIISSDGSGQFVTPEMIQLKNEQLNILRELATKEPNKVASVLKKWVTQ